MPSSTMNNTKNTQPTKATPNKTGRCIECWGTHPNHKTYCSWSVGSRAAGFNIVDPEYRNTKDTKIEVNGGYARINRHVANVWGTATAPKTDTKAESSGTKDGSKTSADDDWVAVEGNWVEI